MIDLRSDTVTRPTEAMLTAMRNAELGDDSREGDPTVRRLEAMSAEMTGKAAALFVASGTMSNLVSLLAHTGRGGEVLLDAQSHIVRSEMGGIAGLAGLFHRTVESNRGALDLSALTDQLTETLSPNKLATALVCVETTHNSAGGVVLPLDYLAKLHALTKSRHVPLHMDGARVFNAAVALNVPVEKIARHSDSIGFCLSKGLSAPFGSVLCGSAEFVQRARTYRRMVGGGMRQSGVVAAAGLIALEQMVEPLAKDHQRARQLAEGLHDIDSRLADPRLAETNIVMVETGHTNAEAARWVAALAENGVMVGQWSKTSLRMVTHRHITDSDVDQALTACRVVAEEIANSPK